jgi:hypothetical protein
MRRKRIYIAGPISKGRLAENVNRATAAFVELAQAGFAPLCPHWSVYAKSCEPVNADPHSDVVKCYGTAAGNDRMEHADWLGVDLPWVEVADAVLRLPGESRGADAEVAHARRVGVPVFTEIEAVKTWGRLSKAPYYLLPVEVS